jgi:N,N-dimethylformamidase
MTVDPHTVGYIDPIVAAPRETVQLMVSSTSASIDVSVVRLIHADERGPRFRSESVPSSLDGTYATRVQDLPKGSYVRVRAIEAEPPVSLSMWVMPTFLASGEQPLMTCRDLALVITDEGRVRFTAGPSSVETTASLSDRVWFRIDATCGESLELSVMPQLRWSAPSRSRITGTETVTSDARSLAPFTAPLFIGGPGFNGKIASPRFGDSAWDFAKDISSRRVTDVSGSGRDGRTVQMPTKGAIGPSGERDAIHFNDDDLDDAGWGPTVEWTIPAETPSGIYATHVRNEDGEDYVPFVIRPPRGSATAPVLFVAPLFSWLAYGNIRLGHELGSMDGLTPHMRYMHANRLNSLYDVHSDGSGVGYSSWRRPVCDMRPNRFVDPGAAHQFAADLHLVDWLHHKGIAFDVVTDAEMHREGADLLGRYRVVFSGSHAEYWSAEMLDALEAYTEDGGRYMYLSGNGLYCVTGFDEEEQHTVEVRRYGAATSAWHADPGERFLTTTGEEGGLWRFRGRPPQRYVGVGFSGCLSVPSTGPMVGAPYRRLEASTDPRAAFVFEGVDGDVIGDAPNLVFEHGAAGFELDRVDFSLGTPPHALVLASATEFHPGSYMGAHEEYPGYNIRADMTFFETPNGGAVFSTGSISWCGALSYNDYENDVSRITANVLRRFSDPKPFALPLID